MDSSSLQGKIVSKEEALKQRKIRRIVVIVMGVLFALMSVIFTVICINDYKTSSSTYADFDHKEYVFDYDKQNDLGDGDYQCYVYVEESETPLKINNLLSTRTVRERLNTLNKGDIISCYVEPHSNNIVEMAKGDQFILSLEERNQVYKRNAVMGFIIVPVLIGSAIAFVICGLKTPLNEESELDRIYQFKKIKTQQEGSKAVLRKISGIGHYVAFIGILIGFVALGVFFPGIFNIPLGMIVFGGCFLSNFVVFIALTFGKITLNTDTKEICIYNPFPHKRKFDEVDRITTFYDNSDSEGAEICRLVIQFKDGKEVKWRTMSDEQSKQLEKKLKILLYPDDHVFR